MLFSNHSHNIFRREINKSVRALLFKKVILNPKFSNDEKVSLLTQDMEYVGDNYLENINVMVSWGFVVLVTAIYIVSQNFLLGLIFCHFYDYETYSSVHHESSFTRFGRQLVQA